MKLVPTFDIPEKRDTRKAHEDLREKACMRSVNGSFFTVVKKPRSKSILARATSKKWNGEKLCHYRSSNYYATSILQRIDTNYQN